MAVGAILETEDYRVIEASDGASAFEIIDRQRPDIVLLDVMMPGMNGREFLHTLRVERGDSQLPVIVMTALRGAIPSQFLALGASDFVYKPFDQELLLDKIALAVVRTVEQDTLPDRPHALSRSKVVLWVDSDRQRRAKLDRLLTERGFTMVSVSETNQQLPRLARALEPHAIVLNMTSASDDGASALAAVRDLRQDPSLDLVPILATSPSRPNQVEISALDAHATSEPLNDDDLIAFIAQPPVKAARLTRA